MLKSVLVVAADVKACERKTPPPGTTLPVTPPFVGAASRSDYLPHSRAARAATLEHADITAALRSGAREHEFGEGRAPAGGNT